MTIRPGSRDFVWMIVGATIFFAIAFTTMRFHRESTPAKQILFKAKRLELVGQMREALASASEAEKSAVLAITDEESKAFADQARAASASLDQAHAALGKLLETGGTKGETDRLDQFSQRFTEFKHIDDDLLGLAVKNTNVKAYNLAFGPAAQDLKEMDSALSRMVEESANSTSPQAKRVMLLASVAQTAALRIQTLLPPHIAEENDQKMDDLEAEMRGEDQKVHKALEGLASLQKPMGSPDLEMAMSAYARLTNIRAQILKLSRENTNVRSLSASLNQKRKVMFACQAALIALEQAIQGEPIEGEGENAPTNPRKVL
jgi:hypothetical protein